jgi:membrane fusion protein (multidrug efflux system)
MKRLAYILTVSFVLVGASACQEQPEVEQKKAQLATYKEELFQLKASISQLENELVAMGAIETNTNLILVSTFEAERGLFEHRMEVRGSVRSRNNIMLSAEVPGAVTDVRIVEGQSVKKGEVMIVQDAQVLLRSINELKSSLGLATTMYERQKKLWESNIGTEVQYLEAKNRMESLELRLATTQSELSKTRIKAPFTGVIDMVDIRTGEIAQPGLPIIRLVSLSKMYVRADVSESMVGKFKRDQLVEVFFPSTDERLNSKISAIGQVINPQNRTFEIEVRLNTDITLKPNMITVLTLTDYVNDNAIAVPTKIIQTDREGKFIYAIEQRDGQDMAIRHDIETGITYGTKTEITAGLDGGEILVDKGGLELSDGTLVNIANN